MELPEKASDRRIAARKAKASEDADAALDEQKPTRKRAATSPPEDKRAGADAETKS